MNKVKSYFNKKAENYSIRRSNGLMRKYIDNEKATIITLLDISERETVLDLGCGDALYARYISSKGGEVFGVDISEEMIKKTRSLGVKAIVADSEYLNLKMEFDKVLCSGLLEFSNDPEKILSTIKRHMKSGGETVILFPKRNILGYLYQLFHLLHGIKIQTFKIDELKERFSSKGFELIDTVSPNMLTCVFKLKLK